MSQDLILTNARVVTRDDVFIGSVVVRDGRITAVDEGLTSVPGAQDLDGDSLLPGLIEMHTDNMEKHFEPRPGVLWPDPVAAVLAHDTQVIGAGITTVLDAVSIGSYESKATRRHIISESIAAVRHVNTLGLFRADHMLHLRCEVSDSCVVEMFEPHLGDPLLKLASVMDHTPGQRQWTDVSKFVEYNKGEHWSEDQLADILEQKRQEQARYSHAHRRAIVDLCRAHGLPLASHDDASAEHIDEAVADGCTIAEFPLNAIAAGLARKAGMGTIMGAPNVIRGGSHSGNVSALDLARQSLLTGLSSDYVPAALLPAAFLLESQGDMRLPEAVACVSANVADMIGLDDRGRIATGLRGDLVRVHMADTTPIVREVWRDGRRAY